MEDAMLKMFTAVNGELSKSCSIEFMYYDTGKLVGIAVYKDGEECWRKSKLDILFDYIAQKEFGL